MRQWFINYSKFKRFRHQGSVVYRHPWWQGRLLRGLLKCLLPLGIVLLGLAVVLALIQPKPWQRYFEVQRVELLQQPIFFQENEVQELVWSSMNSRSLLAVDLYAIKQRLQQVSWVQRVDVQKKWPGVITVRLWEREPFARLGEDELIDVYGVRFKPPRLGMYHSLTILDSPEGFEADILNVYKKMYDWALSHQLNLQKIEMDKNLHWHLYLDNGIHVLLGNQDLNMRIARLGYLKQHFELDPQWIESINMNYVDACAIKIRSAKQPSEQGDLQMI